MISKKRLRKITRSKLFIMMSMISILILLESIKQQLESQKKCFELNGKNYWVKELNDKYIIFWNPTINQIESRDLINFNHPLKKCP